LICDDREEQGLILKERTQNILRDLGLSFEVQYQKEILETALNTKESVKLLIRRNCSEKARNGNAKLVLYGSLGTPSDNVDLVEAEEMIRKNLSELYGEKNIELVTFDGETIEVAKLIPVCCNCDKVRDTSGEWHQVKALPVNSNESLTHGICPPCIKSLYSDFI